MKRSNEIQEEDHWLKKLAGENKAEKMIDNLPVYQDSKSGQTFVTMGDLRQLINDKQISHNDYENHENQTVGALMRDAIKRKTISMMADYISAPAGKKQVSSSKQ